MRHGLLIGLTRARVALLIAGLAWFMGLSVPPGIRIVIAVLVLAGIAGDGAVEEQRIRKPASAAAHDDYRTAA
ncbi:hypothetical protein [Streptomyces natalensis]|uniref:Uncharacterized protein n=1 Tax=Streptomyces natalensis ATCC 27448 TaxID=1240678 RepID=A0A0D7CL01_9ACTN|nr:hypothetical protein [Streptomyces natalensis]KIZ16858.1 hypothetical protein SNA_17860 [Streptomyces natalensis ATCC 27448]